MGGLNMSGPFGLAYGLGQAGKDIGQGMVQGQLNAPRLQAQDIANQQAGLNLQKSQYAFGGQQSANQELGNAINGTDWSDDQVDSIRQMGDAYETAGQKMAAKGRGDLATSYFQQATDLQQKAKGIMLGKIAQYAQTGNTEGLKTLAPKLGFGDVSDVKKNDDGDYEFYGEGDKKLATLPAENLSMINASPAERLNYLARKHSADLAYQGRTEAAETGAGSRESVAMINYTKGVDVAKINADRMRQARAAVGAERATALQKNVNGYAGILIRSGMSPEDAQQKSWEKFLPGAGSASTAQTKGAMSARDAEIKRLTDMGADDPSHPDNPYLKELIADRRGQAKSRVVTPTAAPVVHKAGERQQDSKGVWHTWSGKEPYNSPSTWKAE